MYSSCRSGALVQLPTQPVSTTTKCLQIGQALGSVRCAWSGLRQFVPELFIDTTGWAFPYPLARLAGSRVAAYVHYPTISTDMLQRWAGGTGRRGCCVGGKAAWRLRVCMRDLLGLVQRCCAHQLPCRGLDPCGKPP